LNIIKSVEKIQTIWKKKKAVDEYIIMKDNQNNKKIAFIEFDKIIKRIHFSSFMDKMKEVNKNILLEKIGKNFAERKNQIIKYGLEKINNFIKGKYLTKMINTCDNAKGKIIHKYLNIWEKNTKKGKKLNDLLGKFVKKKDFINKGLVLSTLLKWIYRSKCRTIQKAAKFLQKHFKSFKNSGDIINNWNKLKNLIIKAKEKEDIKKMLEQLKNYKKFTLFENIMKKHIKKKYL
jgi:hypothetical protein